jgi:hypothetical protein
MAQQRPRGAAQVVQGPALQLRFGVFLAQLRQDPGIENALPF